MTAQSSTNFAFLIHPRRKEDVEIYLNRFSPRDAQAALNDWTPVVCEDFSLCLSGKAVRGLIIAVPLTAAQMEGLPRNFVRSKVLQAAELAVQKGCAVIGLGAMTSVITRAGRWLSGKVAATITTGNSFTAAVAASGIRTIGGGKNNLRTARLAIVGASGSVGQCCARLMSGDCGSLLLLGRNRPALESAAAALGHHSRVTISTELRDVRQADIVLLCTATAQPVLGSEYLQNGALLYDLSQPSNFYWSPADLDHCRSIRVFEGGLVRIPGLQMDAAISFGTEVFFACFAETVLLALKGNMTKDLVGRAEPLQATRLERLGRSYSIEPVLPPPMREPSSPFTGAARNMWG